MNKAAIRLNSSGASRLGAVVALLSGCRRYTPTRALALAMASGAVFAQPVPALDVPYVPTPQRVVDRMLQMADVKATDYVIDVGCGDGRMVVSAARDYGARGLCNDIDPVRIGEARQNARRSGVADKVEFRQGDLYEVDISKADVLPMYLLESINLKLRPKILSDARPGTRVVSHAFSMGDWKPDMKETGTAAPSTCGLSPPGSMANGRFRKDKGKNPST